MWTVTAVWVWFSECETIFRFRLSIQLTAWSSMPLSMTSSLHCKPVCAKRLIMKVISKHFFSLVDQTLPEIVCFLRTLSLSDSNSFAQRADVSLSKQTNNHMTGNDKHSTNIPSRWHHFDPCRPVLRLLLTRLGTNGITGNLPRDVYMATCTTSHDVVRFETDRETAERSLWRTREDRWGYTYSAPCLGDIYRVMLRLLTPRWSLILNTQEATICLESRHTW